MVLEQFSRSTAAAIIFMRCLADRAMTTIQSSLTDGAVSVTVAQQFLGESSVADCYRCLSDGAVTIIQQCLSDGAVTACVTGV